jgi:hypothetical protein
MTRLQQAAVAYQQSPMFTVGFVALLLAGAALGIVGALSLWALRIARCQPLERVRAGLWLALASMVGSAAGAGLNGGLAISRHVCPQGPPELYDAVACRMGAVAALLSVGSFLLFLASFVVFPPWKRPSELQAFRVLNAVAGTLAFVTVTLVGWD